MITATAKRPDRLGFSKVPASIVPGSEGNRTSSIAGARLTI
jgi:hypothetical protein